MTATTNSPGRAGGRAPSAGTPCPEGAITALEPDPRRAASVRIYVAGKPYYTISREAAAGAGLAIGRAIDPALHEQLGRAADAEAAFRTAVGAIGLRSYARVDLGRRLVRRGHPREAVAEALERADALGLLDDAAYAREYVQTRAARGRGPVRLQRDLLSMGVARADIDRAIAAHWPEGTEERELPLALARRRAAQLGGLAPPVRRRRVLAYLARRGFTGRAAMTAVTRALEG